MPETDLLAALRQFARELRDVRGASLTLTELGITVRLRTPDAEAWHLWGWIELEQCRYPDQVLRAGLRLCTDRLAREAIG